MRAEFLENCYLILLQEDVMFRYFVLDSSVIIGVLEEPFVDDGMVILCTYSIKCTFIMFVLWIAQCTS